MGHRAVLVTAASLCALALFALLSEGGRPSENGVIATGEGPRDVVSTGGDERASLAVVPELDPDAATPERGASGTVLLGRCVGRDLQPVADATVVLDPGEGGTPVTVRTDGEGRFTGEVAVIGGKRVALTATAARRAPARGRLVKMPPSARFFDVGDVLVPRGGALVANLVAAGGTTVPGVEVTFTLRGADNAGRRFRTAERLVLTSDAFGRLRSEEDVVAGVWEVELPRYLRPDGPASVVEVRASGDVPVDIPVVLPDPSTTITGRVVDASGSPVRGVGVSAMSASSRGSAGYGRTTGSGEFVLVRRTDVDEPVQLRATAIRPRGQRYDDKVLYEWGTQGVELRLRETPPLVVRVVDADTGAPVAGGQFHWTSQGIVGRDSLGRHRLTGGEDGSLVHGLPGGAVRAVVTDCEGYAPSDVVEFEVDGSEQTIEVAVDRGVPVPVRVRYADGTPAAGTTVQLLLAADPGAVTAEVRAMAPEKHVLEDIAARFPVLCSSATTGDDGTATLTWRAPSGPMVARLRGPDHLTAIARDVVVREGAPTLEFVVQRGATLSGVVDPTDVLDAITGPSRATIRLTYVGPDPLDGDEARRKVNLDAIGRFSVGGLRAGTWTVQLVGRGYAGSGMASSFSETFEPVELAPDEEREIALDVSHLAQAAVSGQVRLDGAPLVNARFDLSRLREWTGRGVARGSTRTVRTDADGRFTVESLRPGTYVATIRVDGRAGLDAGETFTVEAGETRSVDLRIDTGHLFVRIVDGDGAPVVNRAFVIEDVDVGYRDLRRTDADGVLESTAIAAGVYALRTTGDPAEGPAYRVDAVDVLAGEQSVPVERVAERADDPSASDR